MIRADHENSQLPNLWTFLVELTKSDSMKHLEYSSSAILSIISILVSESP